MLVYRRYIPFSQKLSQVKTFANFVVVPPSAKVLSVGSNMQSAIRECFIHEMLYFNQSANVFTHESSGYTVYITGYDVV